MKFLPCFMSLDTFQYLLVYRNMNRICMLLLCENCINLNYVELVHSAFQVYISFYFSILPVSHSVVLIFATPRTVVCQALPSMEFSRQEYWGALPFPPPGDFPDPGIKRESHALQGSPTLWADPLSSEAPEKPHFSVYSLY